MNCNCDPPKPVISKIVQKDGPNFGRDYYCCSGPNACNFFAWKDAAQPALLAKFPTAPNKVYQQTSVGSKVGKVKIKLHEIEQSPARAWCSLVGIDFPGLKQLMDTLAEKAQYDRHIKMYVFDFSVYDHVVAQLRMLLGNNLEEIPKFVVQGLNTHFRKVKTRNSTEEPVLDIEPTLAETLRPFQLEGVKFVVRMGGRAYIGDEMGCGKTVQAIAVMQHYRQFWPVLLLVPVSLANQWKEQLLLFSGDIINDKDIVIVRKASDKVASKVVSIVPYSLIEVLVENNKITPQQFGIVVADEAHNLKNMDTKRAKAALPLMRSADVALCLSGTPATNRPVELFSQLSGLLPDFFNDYDQYTKRYCDAKKSRFGHGMDVTGSSNESELKNILSGIVMIRRMKDQIGNQLPKKIRVVKWVDPDKNSVPELDALRKQMAAIDKVLNNPSRSDEHPKYRAQQQSTINAYTRATGISKISAIKKELSSLIEAARIERARELSSYDTTKAAKTSSSSKFKEPPEVISLEIQDDIVTEKADDVIDMTKDDDDPLFIDTPIGIDDSATNKRPNKVTIDDADKNSAAKLKDGTNQNVCKKLHANEVMKLLKQVSDECSDSEEEDVMEIVSTKNVTRKRPLQEKTKKVRKGKKNKKLVESDEDESVDQQRESIGQKIILFAHHQQVLDILAAFLDELEVGFIRVDGKVTNKVRNDAIKRFQEDGKTDVALLSVTACGAGLNLTRANIAVFAELQWSAGNIMQAEDRIHRIGQKADSVKILYLLARESSDSIVWKQIQAKHNVLGATVGMADTKGGGMVINTQENSQDRSQATMDPYLAQSMRMHFDQMSSAYNAKVSGNQTSLDSFVGNKTTNKKKFVDSTTKIDDPTVELVPKDETDTIRPKALGPLQQTILPFVKAFHANKAASDSSSSLPTVKKAVTTVSPDDPMVSKVSDSAAVIKTKTTTDQGKLAYPVYNLYPPLPSYTVSNNTVNDSYKFNGGITATAQFAASPYSDFIYDSASQNSNVANNKSHLHTTVGDGYQNPTIVPPVFAKQSVTTSSSGKVLTEEEKQRIAKNREIALERRRLAEQNKAPASNTNQTMPYNASGGYSNGQIMSSSVNHPIVHNVLSSFDQNKSIAEKAPYGYPSVPVNGIVDNVSVNPYVFSTASGGKVQVSAGAIGEGMGVMKSAGKCHSGR